MSVVEWDLYVSIGDSSSADDEASVLLQRLRTQLRDVDVEAVEPVAPGEAPPNTKSVAAIAAMLGVRLGGTAVTAVVSSLRDWVSRSGGHSVEVTIDGDTIKIPHATTEQQEKLIEVWLARHALQS